MVLFHNDDAAGPAGSWRKGKGMERENYYEALGIAPGADDQTVKNAYRKKAFEYHPDRNAGNAAAAERMKRINEAYAVLSNPEKRRHYDALLNQYGSGAGERFRSTFTEQEIFRESDIQQIFEEMARAFGLRGFDDIFRDFQGGGKRHFEYNRNGIHARGFFFGGFMGGAPGRPPGGRLFGELANKMLRKLTGIQLPQPGRDIRDSITLQPDFARTGGPYAYYHRQKEKKLVVHVPAGIRDGQVIRLAGLGSDGAAGAPPGDLFLAVKFQKPLMQKIKNLLKSKNDSIVKRS
jgi:DnaJ-class molecular chaperone